MPTTTGCRLTYPFGVFNIPTSRFGAPDTGTALHIRAARVISQLNLARAHGLRLIVVMARTRSYFQNADGSFNLGLFEAEFNSYLGLDLSSYIADGTLLAIPLMDEPQDPGNWNGHLVAYSDIDAAAAYVKSKFPGARVIVGSHFDWLLAGGYHWQYLDGAIDPLTYRNSPNNDPMAYAAAEVARAKAAGMVIYTDLNGINGGVNGGEMTAAQLSAWGTAFINMPNSSGEFLWTWSSSPDRNGSYWNRADIAPVVNQLAQLANGRNGCPP